MNDLERAAELLRRSKWAVALTGAGISVESGIPDFRSPGGLWEKFDPMEYATIDAFRGNPVKVWNMLIEMGDVVRQARPNAGHFALAEMEKLGVLKSIVTQNIDNMHQTAGSRRVIEFHGNVRKLVCLFCHREFDAGAIEADAAAAGEFPPRCPHDGHILKPNVVFFGETIPVKASIEANQEAEKCDVMLVAGTSATVYPASSLPLLAGERGATVIEVNLVETGLTHYVADISLHGSTGEILPRLVELLKAA